MPRRFPFRTPVDRCAARFARFAEAAVGTAGGQHDHHERDGADR
jgi:hypothetical protein